MIRPPQGSNGTDTLCPYTTLFRSAYILGLTLQVREDEISQLGQMGDSLQQARASAETRETHFTELLDEGFLPTEEGQIAMVVAAGVTGTIDRKSTRLNSSH